MVRYVRVVLVWRLAHARMSAGMLDDDAPQWAAALSDAQMSCCWAVICTAI